MRVNLWFEDIVDAYLQACADGTDWKTACTEADAKAKANGTPRRVLTQKELQAKGIVYSRQHIAKLLKRRVFPQPFQLPPEGRP
jgi:hypothetical protein